MSKEVVKDVYITDDSKRKITFKTRKASIFKKARALSILCGVEVGAIVFSGDPSDPEPKVWPDHEGVQQLIERYQAILPVAQTTLKRDESIQARINKGKDFLMRRRHENHIEEISQQMIQCMEGKAMPNHTNWHGMKMLVEHNLKNINWEVHESGKEVEFTVPPSSMPNQLQHFSVDVPAPSTSSEGLCSHKEADLHIQTDRYGASEMLQPSSSAKPYIPTSPLSEGLTFNVQNEMLIDQNLQYDMDIGTLEDYMGFGTYEMPQPSNHANSFYNPFSP